MALHYSNGTGTLHDKEIEKPIAEVQYQLIETDATKYASKKWWGEFFTKREVKNPANYLIEFDDGRKAECVVFGSTTPMKESSSRLHYYRFYSRGRLGGGRFSRR